MKVFIIVMAVALVGLVAAKSSVGHVQVEPACEGCKQFFTNAQMTLEDKVKQDLIATFVSNSACPRLGINLLITACDAASKFVVPLAMDWLAGKMSSAQILCYAVGSCLTAA